MFAVQFDKSSGVIRCRIEGFLSNVEVQSVITATEAAREACRRMYGDMKMLVVTDGQVQSADAMALVGAQRARTASPYDRRAFVLPTSLQKMQVSRVFNSPIEQCFVSEYDAIVWLLEDRKNRVLGDRAA